MRKFKCTFLKTPSITMANRGPAEMIEQNFYTDNDNLVITPVSGYTLMAITEYLPDSNQCKDEKAIQRSNN
jgi:hypothetical protein